MIPTAALALAIVACSNPGIEATLKEARTGLEAYLSQIESIHLLYGLEWIPSPEGSKARERIVGRRREDGPKETITKYDLLYSPQLRRLKTATKEVYADGSIKEFSSLDYWRNGERTEVAPGAKQVVITTSTPDEMGVRHPLCALGLQLPGTDRFRLTELLSLPEVTRVEREETIEGLRTLALTIGPGIPAARRARWMTENTTVKVWLARDRHYIPLRTEIRYEPKMEPYRLAVSKLAMAQDATGHDTVPFPREVVFEDAGGTTRWPIKLVTIRPNTSPKDFEPETLPGFVVIKDGHTVTPRLSVTGPTRKAPPRDLHVGVLDVRGTPIEGADVSGWDRNLGDRSIDTAIPGVREGAKPFDRARTAKDGTALLSHLPGEDVTIRAEHPEHRPAEWGVGPNAKDLRIYLLPKTRGVVRDEAGKPVAGAMVSSTPASRFDQSIKVHPRVCTPTDAEGRFLLVSPHTVRGPETPVPVSAVDWSGRASLAICLARELDRPIELTLRPARLVQARVELPAPGPEFAAVRVADQNGREFLSYAVRRNEKNPKEYPWTLGLPPGTYRLTFEETSVSSEVVIPLKVPPGEGELDLGTRLARPSHLELLRGELAPDLAVRWRVGDRKQLSQLRGKVVVLYFWGYWCVPCVKGMPSLMQTADRLQGEPVVWIAIHDASLDTVAALEEQLRRLETAWGRQLNLIPALDEPEPKSAEHGGITCTRYAVRSWPAVVLIDQKGKVAGSVPKEDVEAAIQRLLQK